MNASKTVAALGVASAMALGPALSVAQAEGISAPNANAEPVIRARTQTEESKKVFKTSNEILKALVDVRAARMAIFDGDAEAAQSMADSAVRELEAAEQHVTDLTVQTSEFVGQGGEHVPFDTAIALADGFHPTAEDDANFETATQHFSVGDETLALESLILADVDFVFLAALLPVRRSLEQATDAARFISEGAFFDANLALKAIEGSVFVDSYGISSIPDQGAAG